MASPPADDTDSDVDSVETLISESGRQTVDTVISFRNPFADTPEETEVGTDTTPEPLPAPSDEHLPDATAQPSPGAALEETPKTTPEAELEQASETTPDPPRRQRPTVPLQPPPSQTREVTGQPSGLSSATQLSGQTLVSGQTSIRLEQQLGLFSSREWTVIGWALALGLIGAFAAFGLGLGIGLAN